MVTLKLYLKVLFYRCHKINEHEMKITWLPLTYRPVRLCKRR